MNRYDIAISGTIVKEGAAESRVFQLNPRVTVCFEKRWLLAEWLEVVVLSVVILSLVQLY